MHDCMVWKLERTGAFVATVLLSWSAAAQSGTSPSSSAMTSHAEGSLQEGSSASEAAPREGGADIAFDERARRYRRVAATLSAERENAIVEQIAERYARLVQFTRQLQARADAEFGERAERYMRLRELTRRLEREQAEQEAQSFDARLELFLRKRAFMRRLTEGRTATRTEAPDRGGASSHDELYTR